MDNFELVCAFSLLIQEELEAIIETNHCPGWTITDIERDDDDSNLLEHACFLVSVSKSPAFMPSRDDFFRVQIAINHNGLIKEKYPWERLYVGKAHIVLSVYHSWSRHSVSWLPGLSKPTYSDPVGRQAFFKTHELDLHDVCDRILWHVEDPKCQEGLANKLYDVFKIYLITRQKLPDH